MANRKKDKEMALQITSSESKVDLENIKSELKDYITLEIRKEFNEEIEKSNKRLIKEKNKSLISKNIIILILISLITFLIYLMYHDGYFKRLFNKDSEVIISNTENNSNLSNNQNASDVENIKKEEEKYSLDELKDKYSYLLDNIYINEESKYIYDYYNGNLSNELKNYLTCNMIDFKSLSKDDNYNIIDDDTMRIKHNKLFSESYESANFDYNGNELRYINRINSYISSSLLEKKDTNIKRDIVNIDVTGNNVTIETKEYLYKDNMIYNILTNKKITELNNDEFIYMIYYFEGENLVSIKRK